MRINIFIKSYGKVTSPVHTLIFVVNSMVRKPFNVVSRAKTYIDDKSNLGL